ncbi:MAG: type II toxin-antitoxin system RelE family toxin [Rhodoluna sp.]
MLDSPGWILEWKQTAERQLRKLDKPVAQRVLKKLQWLSLSPNPEMLLKPLKENRSGQHSLRIQEYRAILELMSDEYVILIVEVGHRNHVYED